MNNLVESMGAVEYEAELARLREELAALRNELRFGNRAGVPPTEVVLLEQELAALLRRMRGELSDNCPFCAQIGNNGTSQQFPMCHLCHVESDRERFMDDNAALRAALSVARQHIGAEFGFDNWRVEQVDDALAQRGAK